MGARLTRPQVRQIFGLRMVIRPLTAASRKKKPVTARAAASRRQLNIGTRIAGDGNRRHCRIGARGGEHHRDGDGERRQKIILSTRQCHGIPFLRAPP